MKLRDRTERVLKDLDNLHRSIGKASLATSILQEKVDLHRLRSEISDARSVMLCRIFDIEDAQANCDKVENCPECYGYKK